MKNEIKKYVTPYDNKEKYKVEKYNHNVDVYTELQIGEVFGDYEIVDIGEFIYKIKTQSQYGINYKPIIKVRCQKCGLEEYTTEDKLVSYGKDWKCMHLRKIRIKPGEPLKITKTEYHVGDVIDYLTITNFIFIHDVKINSRHTYAICDCKYGTQNFAYELTKLKKASNVHCGCKMDGIIRTDGRRVLYKIGEIVNGWKILEFIERKYNKNYYKFKCACCNEITIGTINAISYKLCEKRQKDRFNYIQQMKEKKILSPVPKGAEDLIGQHFGTLEVIGFSFLAGDSGQRKERYWLVKCFLCGDISAKSEFDLKYGIVSDGCVKSAGELRIINFLLNQNIKFYHQKSFKDCKYKNLLWFDFYIKHPKTKEWFLLEFQGVQHEEEVDFGDENKKDKTPEEILQNNIIRDNIKREYCKKNKIKLVEITHTKLNQLEKILCDLLDIKFEKRFIKEGIEFFRKRDEIKKLLKKDKNTIKDEKK